MFESTLLQFILFILPGYISISIYQYKYPVKIREDNHDLIWGAAFGLLQVLIISYIYPDIFIIDLNQETLKPNLFEYKPTIIAVLLSGFIFGILSILFTYVRDKILFKSNKLKKLRRSPQSIWHKINTEFEFKESWAVVFLDDDSIYRGFIKYYQFNPGNENQDFLLSKASRIDENLKKKYDVKGEGVYLNTSRVKRIELLEGKRPT